MIDSSGFVYFTWFASCASFVISVFLAIELPVIVPSFKRRVSRKSLFLVQSIQAFLFMMLAGCITFLTWSAVEGGVSLAYKAIALLYMVVLVLYSAFAHRDHPLTKTKFQRYSLQIGIVFYLVFLPGLVCFTLAYHKHMRTLGYREITMPIQNSRIEFDGQYPCESNSQQKCGAYKANLNVNWGKEWACPDSQDVWCDEWITEHECIILVDKTTTTQADFDVNAEALEQCIKEKYGLPVIGSKLEPDAYPDLKDQDQWPEIQLFGTCSSMCETQPLTTDMYRYAERIKLTGAILSGAGLILFFFYYIMIYCSDDEIMFEVCNLCWSGKSKDVFSMRHNAIFRLFQSNRVAPMGATNAGRIQERAHDRISGTVVRILFQREEAGSTNNGIETDPPRALPETPVMVEAAILSSDEDEDSDELSSMSSYGASSDEEESSIDRSSSDEEESSIDRSSSDEEESSIDSFHYESNDETGGHGQCYSRHSCTKSAAVKAAATEDVEHPDIDV